MKLPSPAGGKAALVDFDKIAANQRMMADQIKETENRQLIDAVKSEKLALQKLTKEDDTKDDETKPKHNFRQKQHKHHVVKKAKNIDEFFNYDEKDYTDNTFL